MVSFKKGHLPGKSEVPKDRVSWSLPRIRVGLLKSPSPRDRRGRQLLKGTTFSVAAALPPSREASPCGAAASGFPRRAQHRKFSKNSGRQRDKRCLWDRSWATASQGRRSRGSGGKIEVPRRCALTCHQEAASGGSPCAGERMFSGLSVTFLPFVLFRRAVLSRSPSAVFIYLRGAPGWALELEWTSRQLQRNRQLPRP